MTQKERMLKEMLYYPADTVLTEERAKQKSFAMTLTSAALPREKKELPS